MSTTPPPWQTNPWLLDAGEDTETEIDFVTAESGGRTLGETYDYVLGLRTGHGTVPTDIHGRYNALYSRGRFAGEFTVHDPIDSRPKYTPEWPDASDPLIVSLEPTRPETSVVPGIWGLIESVEAETVPIKPPGEDGANIAQIAFALVYIADIDEYDSHDEIRNGPDALEYDGLF